jgi:hypothetical protein
MGSCVAPDGRLLVLGFYGKSPEPNDGTGAGRAVREAREEGSFGPIHFIRLNAKCHEAQWLDAGSYSVGKWHEFELEIPAKPDVDRCAMLVDGKSPLPRPAYFTDPVSTVERWSFRAGAYRERGYSGCDLPGTDVKAPKSEFLIDDVVITPSPSR